MDGHARSVKERNFFDDYEYKVDHSDDDDGSAGAYDEYRHDGIREDDQGVLQHNNEGDNMSGVLVLSTTYEEHDDRGYADVESEDGQEAGSKLSEKDEHRLLGAFLLASDGGIDGGGSRDGGEEPRLSTHAPTCLQKFTTIAASLGLKTTRDKLREDFEEVVRSNRLVRSSPGHPWLGAHDTTRPVVGFTYKVFRRYYLAKIQGELLEANIRRAWEDLHHGTGGKLYRPGSSATDVGAIEASSTLAGRGKRETTQNQRQHQRRDSDSDRHPHGRPYVARAELQKILTRDGEALTDEEVDELLRECRPDEEGRIVYEGYRRMLIDPSL